MQEDRQSQSTTLLKGTWVPWGTMGSIGVPWGQPWVPGYPGSTGYPGYPGYRALGTRYPVQLLRWIPFSSLHPLLQEKIGRRALLPVTKLSKM